MVSSLADTPPQLPGTRESDWQSAGIDYPELNISGCERLVVVAPHPDDETLGVGGLMARCAGLGISVEVVAVTDGEGSHPAVPGLARSDLVDTRAGERERALAELGVTALPVRLGLPDGDVAANETMLVSAVENILRASPESTWCIAPFRRDGHPDHDATGRACAKACNATGARLIWYPIWMWHWARPEEPIVPWVRARSVTLTDVEHAAKLAAIEQFRSQIDSPDADRPPVLGAHVLEHWTRTTETVFP